jgi:acetyl esterase/lipase
MSSFLVALSTLIALPASAAQQQTATIIAVSGYYGPEPDETFVSYVPDGGASGVHPAVLFIHGGAWGRPEPNAGELAECRSLAEKTGWIVTAIGYPTWTTPERRVEPAAVRTALVDLAARPDVDRQRIALWGESAGGQLALLTAYRDSLRKHPLVTAVVSISGPTDMTIEYNGTNPKDPAAVTHFEGLSPTQAAADGSDRYSTTSPADIVSQLSTPTFQAIGHRDPLVPQRQVTELSTLLSELDIRHQTRYVSGSDHSYPIEFERPTGSTLDVQQLAINFITATFPSRFKGWGWSPDW